MEMAVLWKVFACWCCSLLDVCDLLKSFPYSRRSPVKAVILFLSRRVGVWVGGWVGKIGRHRSTLVIDRL